VLPVFRVDAQDVDKMRHAVGLKAYSSQQPLDEFRLEANRAFLVLLDSYRDAVVARLMVPDINFSLLLPGHDDQAVGEQLDVLSKESGRQTAGSQVLPSASSSGSSSSNNGSSSNGSTGHGSSNSSRPEQGRGEPVTTSAKRNASA
jgi:preprotein translocase subunit SecA